MRLRTSLIRLGAIAAVLLGCDGGDESVQPSLESGPSVLATVEEQYNAAEPNEIVQRGDRFFFTAGTFCIRRMYSFVPTGSAAISAPEMLKDQGCGSRAIAVGSDAIYTGVNDDVVACPLDAPCDAPRKLAEVGVLDEVQSVDVAGGKLVVFAVSTSPRRAELFTVDILSGAKSLPLQAFRGDAVPRKTIVHGAYVYFVRPAVGGSGALSEDAVERLPIDGTTETPEIVADHLAFVSDFAVDDQGIVVSETGGPKDQAPRGNVRTVALAGGEVTTLAVLQNPERVALTPSSVVVFDKGTMEMLRLDRTSGAIATRETLPIQLVPTTNLLPSGTDVIFGAFEDKGYDANGKGSILRLALP